MYKNKLNKILLSNKPSNEIYKMIKNGDIKNMIPEILKLKGFDQKTPYHDKDVLDHTMVVVDSIKPKLNLRMAALLHDIGKPDCFTIDKNGRGHFYGHHIKSSEYSKIILKRLGYEENFIEDVSILIKYHYFKDLNIKEKGVKKFIDGVGIGRINDIIELLRADIKGKADPENFSGPNLLKEKIEEYIQMNSINDM